MNRAYSLDWSPNALSPNTTKLALKKNAKKVEKLKEELQTELNEKSELLEENNKLKTKVECLNKQLKAKISESEKLKEDVEELQQRLEITDVTPSNNDKLSSESTLLKLELDELKAYNTHLEKENEEKRNLLEKCEGNINSLEKALSLIEKHHEEVKMISSGKDVKVDELRNKCERLEVEISDLKEYNQTLKEEMSRLESQNGFQNSFTFENTESLGRELEFQSMKDKIEQMTTDIRTIEDEQSKLIFSNTKLTEEKTTLEVLVVTLESQISSLENRSVELNENLTALKRTHQTLKVEKDNLYSKLLDAKEEYDALVNDYKGLSENNATYSKLLQKAEVDLRVLEASKEKVENQLTCCTAECEKLSNKLTAVTELQKKLQKCNEENACQIKELSHRILNLNGEKSELIGNLHRLEDSHNDLNTKYESLVTDSKLQEKLHYEKTTQLMNEKKNVEECCQNLQENLEKLTGDHNSLLTRYEDLTASKIKLSEEIEEKRVLLEAKQQELQDASSKYQSLSTAHEQLQQNHDSSCKEAENLKTLLQTLSREKQSLTDELARLNTLYNNLKNKCSSVVHHCESLLEKNEMETLNEKNLAENNFEAVKSYFHVVINECSLLKSEISRASSHNVELAEAISDLKSELTAKCTQYEDLICQKRHLQEYNETVLKELKETEDKLKKTSNDLGKREEEFSTISQKAADDLETLKAQYGSLLQASHESNLELELLNKEKFDLENQMKTLNLKYEDLQSAHESTREELDILTTRFIRLNEDNAKNIGQLAELQSLYKKTETERSQLDIWCNELVKKEEKQSELLRDYESQVLCLTSEKNSIAFELQQYISQSEEKLSTLLTTTKKEKRTFLDEIEELSFKCKLLMQENSKVKDELQNLMSENEGLMCQVAVALEKQQVLAAEVESLKATEGKLTESLTLAEKCVQSSRVENADLNNRIACISADKEELYKKNNLLDEAVRNLSRQKDELYSEKAELGSRLQEVGSQLESVNSENVSLLSDLQLKTQELKNTFDLSESLKNRVEDLESKLHSTAEENVTLMSKLNVIQKELTETAQQMENMSNEATSVKTKNEKYVNTIRLLEQQMENVAKERDSAIQKLQMIEVDLTKSQAKLNTVTEDHGKLLDRNSNLLEELEMLSTLKEELQRKYDDLQCQYEKLEEDKTNAFNELREMLLYQIEQLQNCNFDLKAENEKLTAVNTEKLELLKDVEKHVEKLTSEMSHLKEREESLRQQVYECSENESSLKSENVKLNQAVGELETKEKQLLQQLNELVRERDNLTLEVQSLKEEIEEKEKDRRELRTIATLEAQNIEALKDNEQKLSSEVEKLSSQNMKLHSEVDKLISRVELSNQEREADVAKMKNEFDVVLNEKIAELESIRTLVKEKQKKLDEMSENERYMKMENEKLMENLNHLEEENKKVRYRVEELLKQKEDLYKMEKMNNEAFQSQMQTITSRNKNLLEEIEKQRNVSKNLENEYEKLKGFIGELEEKMENASRLYADQLEKNNFKFNEEVSKLSDLVNEKQSREDTLIKQMEILNVKLVEESQRVSIAQRSHSAQLQKQIEKNKVLEAKLQHYEDVERETLSKRITELKNKLEEALETNEQYAEDLQSKTGDSEILLKENENLLVKVEELEKLNKDIENAHQSLLKEKDDLTRRSETLNRQLDSMNLALKSEVEDKSRIKDEYEIFKEEYRKLVHHKDELESEFKDALTQENKKLSIQCDELKEINAKMNEYLLEKEQAIKMLTGKIEMLEANEEPNLNETHVVASGSENEHYVTLRQENMKLLQEEDCYKKKILELEVELEKEKELYRNKALKLHEKISSKVMTEYDGKLQRAKNEYRKVVTQKFEAQEKEWRKKEEEFKTMLRKSQEHIKDLSAQLWNKNDQLLRCKQDFGGRFSEDIFCSPNTMRKARSAINLNSLGTRGNAAPECDRRLSSISTMSASTRGSLLSESDRRLSIMSNVSQDLQIKKRPPTTSGKRFSLSSAKVFPFPSEEEEQEIFDNACLADLKQGRMPDDDSVDSDPYRLSILQARNSLCPPHLKSSYPAETQFLPLQDFKENDIKMGLALQNDCSDIENLLPGDKLKKTRNQTSYKKPGPPTPSKNGGRLAKVETPRNILKESNDSGNARRKSFTPKFFNNLFSVRGHVTIPTSSQQNDENIPVTPKHNRLSSLRRRFSKNPQELGSTNSGFL